MTGVVDKFLGKLGYEKKGTHALKYEDYCINALWNTEDERRVENMFTLIQSGRLEPDEFEHRLERAYNDHTTSAKKAWLATFAAMALCTCCSSCSCGSSSLTNDNLSTLASLSAFNLFSLGY